MWIELVREMFGQKAGARVEVDDATGKALVAGGSAKDVPGDPIGEAIAKAMADAMGQITGSLSAAVAKSIEEFAKAESLSRKNGVRKIFGEDGKGDPTKTMGHFFLAVARGDRKALEEMGSQYTSWDGKAALAGGTGAQGGFTVPTQFHNELMQLVLPMSVVRPRAMVVPCTSGVIEIPALDVTQTPTSGETSFFGGLQANWEEEGSTIGEEEPTFRGLRLQPRELRGFTLASNSLLSDSPLGLETILRGLFAAAIAWYEDRAFLRGPGGNQPSGMLTSNAYISVTRSAASAMALTDIANIYGRFLPTADDSKCVWACNPTVVPALLTMAATTVGGGNIFIGQSVSGKPKMKILNIDVEVTDKVPALNTAGDMSLLDCSKYVIADRQQIEIAYSEHVAFRSNQGAWRFVSRVDGIPWLRSSVTLSDATNTLSPFVGAAAG